MAKEMGTWEDNCLNVRQHSMCTQVLKISPSRQATAQREDRLWERLHVLHYKNARHHLIPLNSQGCTLNWGYPRLIHGPDEKVKLVWTYQCFVCINGCILFSLYHHLLPPFLFISVFAGSLGTYSWLLMCLQQW